MPVLEDLERGDVAAFTFTTGPDGSLALETEADDCKVLVKSNVHDLPERTPVSVTARVEKVIRADGDVDYLVLDVQDTDDCDTAEAASDQSTAEAPPGSLDAMAADLVGEVRVRRRERDERPALVTDAAGERDWADATRSSEREKQIRTDARDSA